LKKYLNRLCDIFIQVHLPNEEMFVGTYVYYYY